MAGADLCSAADAIDAKLLRQLAPSLYLSGQVGVLLKMNPKGSVNSSTVTVFPESFKRALEGEEGFSIFQDSLSTTLIRNRLFPASAPYGVRGLRSRELPWPCGVRIRG